MEYPSKKCNTCGETKTAEEFGYKNSKSDVRLSNCRACHRQWQRGYYQRTNGRSARNAHLRDTYGITADQYDAMLLAQGGKCAICGAIPEARSFPVDHCHKTGKVRAILCPGCNTGIGGFKGNEETLLTAIAYLRRFTE